MSDYLATRRTLLQTAGVGLIGCVSAASTSAGATVTDEAEGYRFIDVEQIAEGEVANLTIGVDKSSTATVVLGDDEDDHVSAIELEEIADEELILQYDASAAADADSDFGWSVHETADASIANSSAETQLEENTSLPAHSWDLSVGDGLEDAADTYAVAEEFDRATLFVTEPVTSDEYEPTDATDDGQYTESADNGRVGLDDVVELLWQF